MCISWTIKCQRSSVYIILCIKTPTESKYSNNKVEIFTNVLLRLIVTAFEACDYRRYNNSFIV